MNQSINQSINLLDFYLSPANADHWADMQAIAASDSDEALEKLRKYALERFRLDPAAAGALRVVASPNASVQDGEKTLTPAARSTVFADFNTAGLDPSMFPDLTVVKIDRPNELYIHPGYGGHACLGRKVVEIAMAVQLRALARLKNLRRAAGPAGQLKSTTVNGAFKVFMTEDWSQWTPFPSTWKLYYDE
jgi:cytochrome P450